MHYIATGKEERDQTRLGLYLLQEKPLKVQSVEIIRDRSLMIQPGEKNYTISGSYQFKNDAELTSLQPHMHYRGKSMKFKAVYPDHSEEILLSVPNYKFQWQRRYIFEKPKFLAKGTVIIAEAVFDNSPQNPDNPNPTARIHYGPYSQDEMFNGILYYVERK